MTLRLLTQHHLEFVGWKGGCTGSSESTLVKMPHCWQSHVTAQIDWFSHASTGTVNFFWLLHLHRIHIYRNYTISSTLSVYLWRDKNDVRKAVWCNLAYPSVMSLQKKQAKCRHRDIAIYFWLVRQKLSVECKCRRRNANLGGSGGPAPPHPRKIFQQTVRFRASWDDFKQIL